MCAVAVAVDVVVVVARVLARDVAVLGRERSPVLGIVSVMVVDVVLVWFGRGGNLSLLVDCCCLC